MQEKYELKLWFEHGGECLWAVNQKARDKFFTAVNLSSLPLSQEARSLAEQMNADYHTAFDWNDFSKGCIWGKGQIEAFKQQAVKLRDMLQAELGEEYLIIYNPKSF